MDNVRAHEEEITRYALDRLLDAGATIFGPKDVEHPRRRGELLVQGRPPARPGHDPERAGVAIRAGHHCAQLVMRRFGVPATARASFYVYNTPARWTR